jgi:hypothetical protein
MALINVALDSCLYNFFKDFVFFHQRLSSFTFNVYGTAMDLTPVFVTRRSYNAITNNNEFFGRTIKNIAPDFCQWPG